MREVTEIRIDERGDETHESWLMVAASRVQTTARRLFDSEISHRHFISVKVTRCSRKRRLNSDWLHADSKPILEFDMSEAQWGAFVSSFGQGGGVPATLTWYDGPVPQAPFESRLDESAKEVREAGAQAIAKVKAAEEAVDEAFQRNAGRKEMRALLRDLHFAVAHVPANMEFAASSLTEHVENVVTKAKADIEAAILAAEDGRSLTEGGVAGLLDGEEAPDGQ